MEKLFDDLINSIKVENVSKNTRFWLIRSKKGFFYEEFVKDNFIALGWNMIDQKYLSKLTNIKEEELKKEIKEKYDVSQPGRILNKCKTFINEVHENDIIMIPSAHNTKITFAFIKDYYEMDYNEKFEDDIIKLIDNDLHTYNQEITCPYKKRRKIEIIKEISSSRLNPNLYKLLAACRHGISNADDYAEFILSAMFSLFVWNNKTYSVFHVEKKNDIDALSFSGFIYHIVSIIDYFSGENIITTKSNVNSPGDIILTVGSVARNVAISFGIIWLFIGGGKIGKVEINPLFDTLMNWKNRDITREEKQVDLQIKKEKLISDKYDNQIKEALCKKIIQNADNLEIKREDISNVFNLSYLSSLKKRSDKKE